MLHYVHPEHTKHAFSSRRPLSFFVFARIPPRHNARTPLCSAPAGAHRYPTWMSGSVAQYSTYCCSRVVPAFPRYSFGAYVFYAVQELKPCGTSRFCGVASYMLAGYGAAASYVSGVFPTAGSEDRPQPVPRTMTLHRSHRLICKNLLAFPAASLSGFRFVDISHGVPWATTVYTPHVTPTRRHSYPHRTEVKALAHIPSRVAAFLTTASPSKLVSFLRGLGREDLPAPHQSCRLAYGAGAGVRGAVFLQQGSHAL